MHYFALVEIAPDAEDVKAATEEAMRPYSKHNPDSSDALWDWWVIGGRWTGALDGYEPQSDRRNMQVCRLCHGSGRRDDDVARELRLRHPDYGCNGCASTGIEVKHPTEWVFHEGDVSTRAQITRSPYTLVAGGRAVHRETWDGVTFVDTSADLDAAWSELSPEARLVVVDYHR